MDVQRSEKLRKLHKPSATERGAAIRSAFADDRLLAGAAFSIPAAYMFSVYVYKVWYIVAVVSGLFVACALVVERPSRDELKAFAFDAIGIALYAGVMLLSGMVEKTRVSTYWLFVDAIYPPVFGIFYVVGARCRPESIIAGMRLLLWAGLAAFVLLWDTGLIRQGYRASFVLPYVVPFVVIALYAGRRLAGMELGIVLTLLVLGMSRTPLMIGCIATGLSLIAFAGSQRAFLIRSLQAAAWLAAVLVAAWNINASQRAMLTTYVRVTGHSVDLPPLPAQASKETLPPSARTVRAGPSPEAGPARASGEPERSGSRTDALDRVRELEGLRRPAPNTQNPVTIRAEADLERQWISDLSWKLLPSAGVLGIGYGNFMLHYAREHPDTNVQSIHNVYVAWLLEGGYAGLAAGLFMVGWFFWWLSVGYRTSNTDDQRRFLKAIGISMVGVLTAAILQQMHQAPMLYVTLGLGMGAVRSIHRTAGLKTIRSSGHLPRSSINVHSSAT
jgi:hypothetical protein